VIVISTITLSAKRSFPHMTTTTPASGAGMNPGRQRTFRFIMFGVLLVLLALLVFAAEWGARNYERNRATPPDYFPQIYYPHKRLRYGLVPDFDYYGWFRINSQGFRGREFSVAKTPGMLRVVCLGGSTTFDIGSIGKALPWPEVMETQLRARLGAQAIEVLNLGIPGSNSLDSLIDLQMRVLALKPDLIVVYQGHNDFAYSFPQSPDPDRYPLEAGPRSELARWLRHNSVLYSKAEGKIQSRLGSLFGGGNDATAAGADAAARVDASLERGYTDFANNIRAIAAAARANHIPLVLPQVVLPSAETGASDCQLCAQLPPLLGHLEPAKISAMLARYDSALAQAAADGAGVYHVSTRGFVPSEQRYYHDPIHFGPEGSKLMGEKMAEALLPILARSQATPAAEVPAP
jgi:lysophospholipase L1-like esterase